MRSCGADSVHAGVGNNGAGRTAASADGYRAEMRVHVTGRTSMPLQLLGDVTDADSGVAEPITDIGIGAWNPTVLMVALPLSNGSGPFGLSAMLTWIRWPVNDVQTCSSGSGNSMDWVSTRFGELCCEIPMKQGGRSSKVQVSSARNAEVRAGEKRMRARHRL